MSLAFLVVLTLLVLGLTNSTGLEEKMARNARDSDIALAAAEAALRDGELRVSGMYQWNYAPIDQTLFNTACTSGLCDGTTPPQSWQPVDQLDFFSASGVGSKSQVLGTTTGSPVIPGLSTQPRYLIEIVKANLPGNSMTGQPAPQFVYRITAQGRGRLGTARVVLQEIYLPPTSAN